MIRTARSADAKDIVSIYNYFVETSTVTFETDLVSASEMEERINKILQSYPFIVYIKDDHVVGYAYASQWKTRNAYRNSVEVSIYIKPGLQGQGLGSILMQELIDRVTDKKMHCLIAGITQPNPKSVALHEKFGYEYVGTFKEVGYKFDEWIDVGYWQKQLP